MLQIAALKANLLLILLSIHIIQIQLSKQSYFYILHFLPKQMRNTLFSIIIIFKH